VVEEGAHAGRLFGQASIDAATHHLWRSVHGVCQRDRSSEALADLHISTSTQAAAYEHAPSLEADERRDFKDDFVRHRDDLLISAAMEVTGGREKQAGLLKDLLDDDFRTRAGSLVMGSIYDPFTEGGVAPAVPPRED
jgi:hypothetical protein